MDAPARSRRRVGVLAVLVLVVTCPTVAAAQTCTSGGGGGGPPGGGSITLTPTPALIAFPSPGVPEYQAGRTDYPDPVTIDVRPNNQGRSWNLCIRGSDASAGGSKPVSDLLWSLDGASWIATTTADQFIASGVGDQTVTLYFRMILGWASDPPGTYVTMLTFTALHP